MDTHGSVLDVAVTCCLFGYPVNDGRDVGGPVQLDLRKAVLVCFHHSLDLCSEGKDGRDTVRCSDPQPDVLQHLGLIASFILRSRTGVTKQGNLAQISIINNHVHRPGLTFTFIVLRVEIYGKVMRNLQTGEGMNWLGSTATKQE